MKVRAVYSVIFFLAAIFMIVPPAHAAEKEPFTMLYFPSWQRKLLPTGQVPWKSITHLMVGPVLPEKNGTLEDSFGTRGKKTGERWAQLLSKRAKEEGVTPMLFVGGAGVVNWRSATTNENRSRFAKNLVKTAQKYDFSGIDLDWEPLAAQDHIPLYLLAQEIRRLDSTLILTLPLLSVNMGSTLPSTTALLSSEFDAINIMTYDMAGVWPGWKTWHHSALYGATTETPSSIEISVGAYLNAGIPREKLGIGVPQYGYCWSGPALPKERTPHTQPKPITYIAIMEDYDEPTARRYDSEAQAPYLSFAKGTGEKDCTFISYMDEQGAAARGTYVTAQGLGGVIIWSASQGYIPKAKTSKRHPLITALKNAME